MTSPNLFPVEHLERVLQLVHASQDIEWLRNCSYASQTFCALSQKFLFQEIRLASDEDPGSSTAKGEPRARTTLWQAFNSLLDRSPHLSGYVQTLEITRDVLTLMSQNDEDDCLPKILNHLHNQQKFFITMDKNSAGRQAHVSWEFIAPRIQNALLDGLNSPRIVEIDLSGIPSFPAAHLNNFPATLKSLTITHLKFEPEVLGLLNDKARLDTQCKTTMMRCQFVLKTLVVRDVAQPGPTSTWLSSNICPIDLLQVQDLSLATFNPRGCPESESLNASEEFLKVFALNLKRLTIRLCYSNMETNHWSYAGWNVYYDPYSLPPPDIAKIFPSLQSLELDSSWRNLTQQEAYIHPIPWIHDFLKKLPRMGLQDIILRMAINIDEEVLKEVRWYEMLSGLDDQLKSIIELKISGLNQAGKEILLEDEYLRSLPRGIVFVS